MKLVTLRPQALPRYGLSEQELPNPYFALGLEEEGAPLAVLLALQAEEGWEVPVLECLQSWNPALVRPLVTGLTVWAKSCGISRLTLQVTLSQEQLDDAKRLLAQDGWALEPAILRFSLRTSSCPVQHMSPDSQTVLMPFGQLPLPTRAQFFSSHPQADLPAMGPWEPSLSVACVQSGQLNGCILTASQTNQLTAQVWLPPQREAAGDLLCLWLTLCRRRQIPLLSLQTDQITRLSLIRDLFSGGISGADVQLSAQWPKGA